MAASNDESRRSPGEQARHSGLVDLQYSQSIGGFSARELNLVAEASAEQLPTER
jgi:hypothetical protein